MSMRSTRKLAIAAAIAFLLVVLLLAVFNLDYSRYRHRVEDYVTAATGRTLSNTPAEQSARAAITTIAVGHGPTCGDIFPRFVPEPEKRFFEAGRDGCRRVL